MSRRPGVARGTSNGNATGSAADRRRRRVYLLETFGNGVVAPCMLAVSPDCPGLVDVGTLTVDRIVPGCRGGTYRRDNIRPACGRCNALHGGSLRGGGRSA